VEQPGASLLTSTTATSSSMSKPYAFSGTSVFHPFRTLAGDIGFRPLADGPIVRFQASFINTERFEATPERVIGCGRYIEATIIRLISGVDPPASLVVGALKAIEACTRAESLHNRAHLVPLFASPEPVIQDNIQTEREAARPQRFE
jgi:hypothetical protein